MPRPVKRELSDEQKRLLREIGGLPEIGPIEIAVKVFIGTLTDYDARKKAFGEMAISLARKLDFDAGPQAASVNKELRETLALLAEKSDNPDDLLTNLSDPV